MSALRRSAILLSYACVVLALPTLTRWAEVLWRGLEAAAIGSAAAIGTMLTRGSDLEMLLPLALAGAGAGLGAIFWLMVLPLTREHADAGPKVEERVATVDHLRPGGHPVADARRRRVA